MEELTRVKSCLAFLVAAGEFVIEYFDLFEGSGLVIATAAFCFPMAQSIVKRIIG